MRNRFHILMGTLLVSLLFLAACSSDKATNDNLGGGSGTTSTAGIGAGGAVVTATAGSTMSAGAGGVSGTAGATGKGLIPKRCTGDGSSVAIIGDGYIALSKEIPEFLKQYSSQTYRDYSAGGTLIDDVRKQAQKVYAEGAPETLIMTGGGNDAILNTNCLIKGLENATCKSDVDKALSVLPEIFDEAEKASVKEIIFFYYPHITYKPQFMNVLDDYAIPVAQPACESRTKLDCTFIDTIAAFGGDNSAPYLILDGINPNTKGSEIIAKLVWAAMQDNCANGLKVSQ